jgi:two-component system, cell cycle response regulator CpdR
VARILVVDDEREIRKAVQRALERDGHEVTVAVDGLDGARAVRSLAVDLALIDIHMPEMDGIELLVNLKAAAPTMPVIVMSGGDQSRRLDLLKDATLLGATGILAKPFTLDELREAVTRALGAHGQPDSQ